MKKIFFILILFFALGFVQKVYASENNDILEKQLDILDFGSVKTSIGKSSTAFKVEFESIIKDAITGELDISITSILQAFLKLLFSELYENADIIRELILIGILSALLKNLTSSFKNQAAGEVGFYITYIALILVLLSSFTVAFSILESLVYQISDFINAAIPLMVSLIVMGGNFGGGYAFSAVTAGAMNITIIIVKSFLMPLIMVISTVNIVNFLTENEVLSNFSKLLKDIVTWGIKLIAMGFMGILTIQRISSPILNNIAVKTAKSTVNAVPVVGDILTGAVDMVVFWSGACKSGVAVAILISVVAICAIPIIKLGAFMLIYKVTSALIQPICDKRIVGCINTMGDFSGLLLSTGVITVFMFLFSVMIMLSF